MRHRRVAKKFGRSTSHREQMVGSLVANLILRDRIRTTLAKAKVARQDAEKMVTLARKGTLAARRLAAARLRSPEAVARLFATVVPSLADLKGGYTRIAKLGRRSSDGSTMVIIEWVTVVTPAALPETDATGAAVESATPKADSTTAKAGKTA